MNALQVMALFAVLTLALSIAFPIVGLIVLACAAVLFLSVGVLSVSGSIRMWLNNRRWRSL